MVMLAMNVSLKYHNFPPKNTEILKHQNSKKMPFQQKCWIFLIIIQRNNVAKEVLISDDGINSRVFLNNLFDHKNYQQSYGGNFSRNRYAKYGPNMTKYGRKMVMLGCVYQKKECMLKNVLARCQCWPAFIKKYNATCKTRYQECSKVRSTSNFSSNVRFHRTRRMCCSTTFEF